jgi:putative acetyltransferase
MRGAIAMMIREETPADFTAIRDIHIAAFARHPYSHQTEHLIVDALRADGVLTISLVAEVSGKVAGHIAFSPITIDGEHKEWYILGPIGVLPAMQRQGIGKQLVLQGLEVLRKLGAEGCVLVGDPAYYNRFGFRQCSELNLEGVPAEVFLCLSLTGNIPHGMVEHPPEFFVQA